ncbi:M56 family metallopeptidase [Alkaliphilus peptidifermentans]|uniref:Signal transducer regulating beta-lactamase production, contains metallopeptidase domain n=1 Tax=Alkaliphilus peptidifermentans DSM 18978 TaxID=1120976 RepID=A0A1G5K151_9FIRM|nr:M56 family metallopeptidase [Alkaliphilus peptidifermentans]SCY94365.1 Signal transducer regulating beta-lactamase production, contains metallopeptidase domain [Alkaliphilus peptidifermentans DSM 18978]
MTSLFTAIFNMSITASYIAVAVIAARLFFKKAPKIFSYVLWLPVLVRLIFPFSFSSIFSFLSLFKTNTTINTSMIEYVPRNIGFMENSAIDIGIDRINNAISTSLPDAAPAAGLHPIQLMFTIASFIWIIGIAVLLLYSIISYVRVMKNVTTAVLVRDNIFETNKITTPFVCGFIKPKIYIPTGISKHEVSFILAHEKTHIKRLDYLIKPFSFLVLIIHWFNPLMWLSFTLMSKDMEMSCDESVLKEMGNEIKGNYSNSLLSLSVKRSGLLMGSPLAFGESNIKSRIKNILSYRKPTFGVIILTIIITAVLMVTFLANPKEPYTAERPSSVEYTIENLIANKTPYVGDNSKVVALIDALPLPEGIIRDTVRLHTSNQPYGITINLKTKDDSYTVPNNINTNDFYRNSVILFSLIDNVDTIEYMIPAVEPYSLVYTREYVVDLMGEDIRSYGENEHTLKSLIDQLDTIHTMDVTKDNQIEHYLEIIMSSPKTSSNPRDYIKAHQREYDNILKMGDEALIYLLSQFESDNISNDLRGHIIMSLSKDLLGITDEGLLPTQWYSQLSANVKLPDYIGNVSDSLEQLVYNTTVQQYSLPNSGFTVVAPTILGVYQEEDKVKVFVTVYYNRYKLYGKTLYEMGGGIIPGAITYSKNIDGSYILDEYLEAMDGSYFGKSIKEYCVMPISNEEISGLSDKILDDYKNHAGRSELLIKNLIEHLRANNQKDIELKKKTGQVVPLT